MDRTFTRMTARDLLAQRRANAQVVGGAKCLSDGEHDLTEADEAYLALLLRLLQRGIDVVDELGVVLGHAAAGIASESAVATSAQAHARDG